MSTEKPLFEPHKKAYHEIAKDMEDLVTEITALGEGIRILSADRDFMEEDRDVWMSLAIAFCRAMLELSQDPDDESPVTDEDVTNEIVGALMFLRDKEYGPIEEENSDDL